MRILTIDNVPYLGLGDFAKEHNLDFKTLRRYVIKAYKGIETPQVRVFINFELLDLKEVIYPYAGIWLIREEAKILFDIRNYTKREKGKRYIVYLSNVESDIASMKELNIKIYDPRSKKFV